MSQEQTHDWVGILREAYEEVTREALMNQSYKETLGVAIENLTCVDCGADLTTPSHMRQYCSTCNPIFGKATNLGFEDLMRLMPMPEPTFSTGFARYEMGEDDECWGWRLYKAKEPGSEPMIIGKVEGINRFFAPTRNAVLDGLRKRWEKRLRDRHGRVKAKLFDFSGAQTGRISSKQPNPSSLPKALPEGGVPAGKVTSLQGRAKPNHPHAEVDAALTKLKLAAQLFEEGKIDESHALFREVKAMGLAYTHSLTWEAFKSEIPSTGPTTKLSGSISERRRRTSVPDSLLFSPTNYKETFALFALAIDTLDRFRHRIKFGDLRKEMETLTKGRIVFDKNMLRDETYLIDAFDTFQSRSTTRRILSEMWSDILDTAPRLFWEKHLTKALGLVSHAQHGRPSSTERLRDACASAASHGVSNLKYSENWDCPPWVILGLLCLDERHDWIRDFSVPTCARRKRS